MNQHLTSPLVVHIKNMVCPRCIESVQQVLGALHIAFGEVRLGEAHLVQPLRPEQKELLKKSLVAKGFDLLEDKKSRIVEKVKLLVLQMVEGKEQKQVKLSEYLARQIGQDYSSISGTFTENQGVTIERYHILQKVEKAKELLTYHELTLNEIADRLHYSSAAALSTQFKDVTGMTPTAFKNLREPNRKSLDNLL